MKTFSFAHLNPFGRPKAAEGETQDAAKAKPGDSAAGDGDTEEGGKETPKDGGGNEPSASKPDDRARCAAILAAASAAGRVELACHLAFNTDLTVEQACAALEAAPAAAAPAAATGNPLALAAMDGHPTPVVGAAADAGSLSGDDKAAAAVLASMAACGIIPRKDAK